MFSFLEGGIYGDRDNYKFTNVLVGWKEKAKFFRDGKIIEPSILQRFQVAGSKINFQAPHLNLIRLQSQLHKIEYSLL